MVVQRGKPRWCNSTRPPAIAHPRAAACVLVLFAAGAVGQNGPVSPASTASPTSQPVVADVATPARCLAFYDVTAFSVAKDATLDVATPYGHYGLTLAGEGCSTLGESKDLRISSAPAADLCPGPSDGRHRLTLSTGADTPPINCRIMAVAITKP